MNLLIYVCVCGLAISIFAEFTEICLYFKWEQFAGRRFVAEGIICGRPPLLFSRCLKNNGKTLKAIQLYILTRLLRKHISLTKVFLVDGNHFLHGERGDIEYVVVVYCSIVCIGMYVTYIVGGGGGENLTGSLELS
jgi:hypothetical protein